MQATIQFHEMDDAMRFWEIASSLQEGVELSDGRTKEDGKSMLGLFCLNIKEPIHLNIQTVPEREHQIQALFSEYVQTGGSI